MMTPALREAQASKKSDERRHCLLVKVILAMAYEIVGGCGNTALQSLRVIFCWKCKDFRQICPDQWTGVDAVAGLKNSCRTLIASALLNPLTADAVRACPTDGKPSNLPEIGSTCLMQTADIQQVKRSHFLGLRSI
jgi:hypothetical protein